MQREDWNMYVQVTRTSQVRHLAMSTTKIVLEWTKAVIFIITVVCILLIFGLEKGLKNYTPSTLYIVVTGFYYILTEKLFVDIILKLFDRLKVDYFESMESLYCPVILKITQIILCLIFSCVCLLMGNIGIVLVCCFTNIRVKYRELDCDNLLPLRSYLSELAIYRQATTDELIAHDDVCAVCLYKMTSARVTPCQHYFHAECLRRTLNESAEKCPICQYKLSLNKASIKL